MPKRTPKPSRIFIYGRGRVGTFLHGMLPQSQLCRGRSFFKDLKAKKHCWTEADVIVLALPNDALPPLIACLPISATSPLFFHTSGQLGAPKPCAMLHPALSILSVRHAPSDTVWGVSGSMAHMRWAKRTFIPLKVKLVIIPSKQAALYHLACTYAANVSFAVLTEATLLFQTAGLSSKDVQALSASLFRSALTNYSRLPLSRVNADTLRSSITGPIARNDVHTVSNHLKALQPLSSRQSDMYLLMIRFLHLCLDRSENDINVFLKQVSNHTNRSSHLHTTLL